MSVAKVSASTTYEAMKFEVHNSLDNLISRAIGKEPSFSFTRAGDGPIQLAQLLHALDSHGSIRVSEGSNFETIGVDKAVNNFCSITSPVSGVNNVKESVGSNKGSGVSSKLSKDAIDNVPSLNFSEAVVAFAQASAKANSEPKKYLPGWPLLSPTKLPMRKCGKCSREFCSPVNYKRHSRVHRRSIIIEKERVDVYLVSRCYFCKEERGTMILDFGDDRIVIFSKKKVSPDTRECLGTFWDKLSLDEAKELVSFKNSSLEEISGSSIVMTLDSWIQTSGFSCLPQAYVKAGITLLDVVQARPSRFPILSEEFFGALDDASEKTFLCAGTAISLQRFLFDGEVKKVIMDTKNLIACVSFLLEQELVKAWHASKDAEALRCQKLLVEEEEAAQRRHAEILERRRLKKQRQREHRAKENDDGKIDFNQDSSGSFEGTASTGEILTPSVASDVELDTQASCNFTRQLVFSGHVVGPQVAADERHGHASDHVDQNTGCRAQQVNGQKHVNIVSNSRNASNSFPIGQFPVSRPMITQTNSFRKDLKPTLLGNSQKAWTRKVKDECNEVSTNGQSEYVSERRECSVLTDNASVLIGAIPVSLGDCVSHNVKQSNNTDVLVNQDLSPKDATRSTVKLWRPVSRRGKKSGGLVSSISEIKINEFSCEVGNRIPPENSVQNKAESSESGWLSSSDSDIAEPSSTRQLFSSQVAEAFLKKRWKEVIALDHVLLISQSAAESMNCSDMSEGGTEATDHPSDCSGRRNLGSAENCMATVASFVQQSNTIVNKTELKSKPEKIIRAEYIPEQRNEIER